MAKVIIFMGSKADLEFSEKIKKELEKFNINSEYRISSAHKTTQELLDIIKKYEENDEISLFIAVAGRSNALCGVLDGNTTKPVITCPPYSDKFAGADIYSSLRMPSGIAPLVILEPKNAALAAAKIISLKNSELKEKIKEYKEEMKEKATKADEEVRG